MIIRCLTWCETRHLSNSKFQNHGFTVPRFHHCSFREQTSKSAKCFLAREKVRGGGTLIFSKTLRMKIEPRCISTRTKFVARPDSRFQNGAGIWNLESEDPRSKIQDHARPQDTLEEDPGSKFQDHEPAMVSIQDPGSKIIKHAVPCAQGERDIDPESWFQMSRIGA